MTMTEPFLFRFTPSLMEREALEAIFVQREDIVQRILDLIRDSAFTPSKHRTLLVLIENLDDIFQGLNDEGQKRLRAYIQENPFFTIVATAQSLFNGVSLQSSPFYGFFRIQHLEGLSIEDSTQLLMGIARYRGDPKLASFIQTPTGRARIRAVNHLAGGNHRVYIIFSQFLTRESLDELVEPFMRM